MNHPALKLILICFTASIACNNVSNHDSTTVFKRFSPKSKEYKDELATKLKSNPNRLVYTFNEYFSNKGQEYLNIQVTGDDFKATGFVLVNNWNKLEGIKRTKGLGYSGAELKGLKLSIEENPLGANLVYNNLDKIVD